MKKILLATALITGVVGSVSAANVGPYIAAQGGYSWMDSSHPDEVKVKNDSGMSGELHGGYLFPLTSSLSLGPEIGIGTNFYDYKLKDKTSADKVKYETNYYVPILARLQWQINDDLYLFGKAGVAFVKQTGKAIIDGEHVSASESDANFDFGLGLGYNLSQNLSLEASYNYIDGDNLNSSYDNVNTFKFQNISLGVNYSF